MKSEKTFFEQLIEQETKVTVVCQTDQQYSYAANQCSWCSSQFILNKQELVQSFYKDKKNFLEIYSNCIAVGTQLRHQNGYIPCGQNADNQKLLEMTSLNNFKLKKYTYSQNDFIMNQIAPLIPPFALQQFNGRKHTIIKELNIPKQCDFIMFGRHGQTFAVFPLNEKFLVLDSHVHYAGIMNYQNLIKYIKFEGKGPFSYGYLFVTIVAGNFQK